MLCACPRSQGPGRAKGVEHVPIPPRLLTVGSAPLKATFQTEGGVQTEFIAVACRDSPGGGPWREEDAAAAGGEAGRARPLGNDAEELVPEQRGVSLTTQSKRGPLHQVTRGARAPLTPSAQRSAWRGVARRRRAPHSSRARRFAAEGSKDRGPPEGDTESSCGPCCRAHEGHPTGRFTGNQVR